MFVDYYSILEIEYPSSPEEIKKSYRRLSLKWHPDKHLSEDTSKKMVEINEAYCILNDKEKKARYDCEYIIFQRINKQSIKDSPAYKNTETGYKTSSNSQYSTHNYHFHDTKVQDDIREAHQVAKDLVDEFIRQFENAANGARKEMWPYIIIIVLSPIFFSLIRSCQ